jgi:hypothetical protein
VLVGGGAYGGPGGGRVDATDLGQHGVVDRGAHGCRDPGVDPFTTDEVAWAYQERLRYGGAGPGNDLGRRCALRDT